MTLRGLIERVRSGKAPAAPAGKGAPTKSNKKAAAKPAKKKPAPKKK